MLMQKDVSNKKTLNDVAKNLTAALHSVSDPDLKKDFESIKIDNAAEVMTSDNKRCFLVQVSEDSLKIVHRVHEELVKKIESKFHNPVVIVPNRRRINGNLFRKHRGTKVPRNQTLTSIYDSLLQDIIFPAALVGKRVRYPKGKARVFKIQVDKSDRNLIEYKLNAIVATYKAFTNRELQVEFA